MNTASPLVETLGWTLLHFLWQAILIALLLWVFLQFTSRRSPQWRYAAATSAMFLLLCAAAGTASVMWRTAEKQKAPEVREAVTVAPDSGPAARPSPDGITVTAPEIQSAIPSAPPLPPAINTASELQPKAAAPPPMERLRASLPWIVGFWAVGVLLCSLRMAGGWLTLRHWATQGCESPAEEWAARFTALCQRLRISQPVRLLCYAAVQVPLAAGWLRPVVLVPASLFTSLSPTQLEAILTHELAHIRRGALLHDMGKMAIPDEILQKPGPLNETEWEKMRRHPMYAYEMLSPIEYLRPALDIPFCHHERWNGSGYPRGLKETEIPLVARLFAIVDVWDALCSDRPYRKKLPKKEVISYLREKSGNLFEPKLIDVFLSVIENEK